MLRGFRITGGLVVGALVAIVALMIFGGSWYTIDQTQRGVLLRNGAISGVAQPGLGFKYPFIDSAVKISVQTHVQTYENMEAYSRDQQPAHMRISVNYRANPAEVAALYGQYGSLENVVSRLINPVTFQQVKIVFGGYTALQAIQDRGRLNSDILAALHKATEGEKLVSIESVQVEDIKYSKAYEGSIEARMLAEVEVQKLRQNAEREKVNAEITVTQATAQANAVRQKAMAESEAIRLRGEAEAQAIRARGAALGDNPRLVDLVQAERWNGQLPSTMVPGGTLPMLGLSK